MVRELGSERCKTVRLLSTGSVYENCEILSAVCKDPDGDIYSQPIVFTCIVGPPHIERITAESIEAGSLFQNKFS